MKSTSQTSEQLIRRTLRQLAEKRQPSPVLADQTDQKRYGNWQTLDQYRSWANGQASFNPLPKWTPQSRTFTRLYNRAERGWAISSRASMAFLAATTIKIETGLMDLNLRAADSGLCIPCYMSIASDPRTKYIFEWQLYYSMTLEQATYRALNSMFEKVPGGVSVHAHVAEHFRYGGTDYEVGMLREGRVWLRPTIVTERCLASLSDRAASRRPPDPSQYVQPHAFTPMSTVSAYRSRRRQFVDWLGR